MSCALQDPVAGACANKRPVRGRLAAAPAQPQLTPLAVGHARSQPQVAAEAREPFSAEDPESTFTMARLAEVPAAPTDEVGMAPVTKVRSAPPSLREIRAGRAAAAGRAPIAEVRIPVASLDVPTLAQGVLPGMDQLVERVRQRTAARLSRGGTASPA